MGLRVAQGCVSASRPAQRRWTRRRRGVDCAVVLVALCSAVPCVCVTAMCECGVVSRVSCVCVDSYSYELDTGRVPRRVSNNNTLLGTNE